MSTIDITIPEGTRAVLVTRDDNGGYKQSPVENSASVMNLRRDLIAQLNEQFFSDGWLEELRDYVDARLEARQTARVTGGLSVPGNRRWQVTVNPKLLGNAGVRA